MDLFRLVRRFFLPRVFVFLGTLLFSTLGNAQLNKPNATAYNHYNDLYYITNYLGQSVVKMDRFGNKSYFVQNLTAPNNLIFADFPFGPAFIVLDSNFQRLDIISGYQQAPVFETQINFYGSGANTTTPYDQFVKDFKPKAQPPAQNPAGGH
jgi:hypothetical protein